MLQNHPRLFHYAVHFQSALWTNFNCGMWWNGNVGRNCRVTSTGEWHTQLDEEGKQWPPHWYGILEGSPSQVAAKTPHLRKQNGFEKAETNSHLSSDHVEMLGIYSWKIGQFKEKTQ